VPGAVDGFELAVRAILGQQVSVAGARTLAGRLVAALGEPLAEPHGSLTHTFPTPERISRADLGGLGLTGGRIVALRALARAVSEGGVALDRGADWEGTVSRLQELPGIGPWTAAYIAMRALGDPDACPVADLGLRRALERRGLAGDPKNVAARFDAWRPWRAYATHHLWASLAPPPSSWASPCPRGACVWPLSLPTRGAAPAHRPTDGRGDERWITNNTPDARRRT